MRHISQAGVDQTAAPVDDQVREAMVGVGHLTRRLNQAHTRLWQRMVSTELTGPQYTVLALLREEDGLDQKTLGERVRLDKSTLAPLLDRLRARELLTIDTDATDRRRKVLRITPAGTALVEELAPQALALHRRLLSMVSSAGQQQFLAEFQRLVLAAEAES